MWPLCSKSSNGIPSQGLLHLLLLLPGMLFLDTCLAFSFNLFNLCSNLISLENFSETTLLKIAPIHFYPFAIIYFFYSLSLPDIIMYIYLYLICLPHWKVSSIGGRCVWGYSSLLHVQNVEHINLAHVSYSENIYEIEQVKLLPNELQGSYGRTADDQHQDWFLLSMVSLKFDPLRADWKKEHKKNI